MRTPLCDQLGIEFPIFAFSHCRDVVAAVSKAGGFGVLGAVAFSPDQLEVELDWIDEHVGDRPYGVDIIVPAKYVGKDEGGVPRSELRTRIPQGRVGAVAQRPECSHANHAGRRSLSSLTSICLPSSACRAA